LPEPQDNHTPRAFWSGTITFGLVSVPVDLYSARAQGERTRMLARDGTPLKRRYRCPEHDRALDDEEIVRGYDTGGGRFVVVEDEELAALAPKKSREIDLQRFVERQEIPAAYFNRAYFLLPSGDTNKAYRLLAATMEETGLAGIGTFVMRGREYLAAILGEGGLLRAETLRFPDEIRTAEDAGLPKKKKVPAAAVTTWKKAIAKLVRKSFDPDDLDEESGALRKLAERKLERGKDVVEVSEAPPEEVGTVIDLMQVLKQRLGSPEHNKKTRSKKAKRKARTKTKTRAKRNAKRKTA